MEDQGEYECVAENLAGQRRGIIRLYVSSKYFLFYPSYRANQSLFFAEAPSIEVPPSSVDAEEGALTSFECKYKGNEHPVTAVDWELNGAPVQV